MAEWQEKSGEPRKEQAGEWRVDGMGLRIKEKIMDGIFKNIFL